MRRLFAGRTFFLVVLAVLVLGGLPHARYLRLTKAFDEGTFRPTPAALLEAVRAHLTNHGDMERYRAYAQAALGRPYSSYFVRTRAEWEAQFARGEDPDPELAPEVRAADRRWPYRDFLVEYPPAFFLIALPPALVSADLDGYLLAFKLLMACCLLLSALCIERYAGLGGRTWMTWMGGAVLSLGIVTTHRFDAAVALGLCASMWAVAERRPVLSGVFIGAAVAIKGAPLLFMGPLLMYLYAEQGLRAAVKMLLTASAVVLLSIAPVVMTTGWALAEAADYHRVRPLQIESTLGSLLALCRVISRDVVTSVMSYGSVNLAGRPVAAAGALTSILMLLGILLSYSLTWWRIRATAGLARRQAVMEGIVLTGLAFMLLGKVFSPQYLTWILPLCVSAAILRGGRKVQLLILLMIATQVIYPITYSFVMQLQPWVMALVVARNLGLAAWGSGLIRSGDRDPSAPSPAISVESSA